MTARVVFGAVVAVPAAPAVSLVSTVVNAAFVERHSGSDRNRTGAQDVLVLRGLAGARGGDVLVS